MAKRPLQASPGLSGPPRARRLQHILPTGKGLVTGRDIVWTQPRHGLRRPVAAYLAVSASFHLLEFPFPEAILIEGKCVVFHIGAVGFDGIENGPGRNVAISIRL